MFDEDLHRSPLSLMLPGLGDSGAGHWQAIWAKERADCERVELGCWDDPDRNVWMSRLDQAIRLADAPVLLVAHSLGCLAVAWWAGLLGADAAGPVRGALLVAPPDVDRAGCDPRIARFAPMPQTPLPFPAILVASSDDPYCTADRSAELAGAWLADLVVLEEAGHINAESGLGAWRDGQMLLETLIDGGPGLSRYPARTLPATPARRFEPRRRVSL